MTNEEIRNWYNQRVSEGIAKLEADIKREKRNPNMADARKAYEIRHQALLDARKMMKPHEAEKLKNPSTFEETVKKSSDPSSRTGNHANDNLSKKDRNKSLSQKIIDSAKRTNQEYNLKASNRTTRDKINARFKKFDASKLKAANDNRSHPPNEPKKARLTNGDRPKNKPNNENQNSAKRQSKDLLKARLKLKKAGEGKNQLTTKDRVKARYGKPKDAKKNLGKSLREKPKASPNSIDRSLAKNKTPNPSKDPRVARTAESSVAKKTGGTQEKKASLRDGYQQRDKALKAARDKKPNRPKPNRENVKSRYGKPSEPKRNQKAEGNSKKPADSRQSKSSSTPKTDTKPKPSGDTKPKGGGGGTSRRR